MIYQIEMFLNWYIKVWTVRSYDKGSTVKSLRIIYSQLEVKRTEDFYLTEMAWRGIHKQFVGPIIKSAVELL